MDGNSFFVDGCNHFKRNIFQNNGCYFHCYDCGANLSQKNIEIQ